MVMFDGFQGTFSVVIKEIVGILTLLSVFVEIAPIKIKPLTFLIKWVGSALFKETNTEIRSLKEETRSELRSLRRELAEHETDQFKKSILDFSNSCMRGVKHTKEEFDSILEEHTKYESITERNEIPNNKLNLAFAFIEECYQKHLRNNDFL